MNEQSEARCTECFKQALREERLSPRSITLFQERIYHFSEQHGRTFPWRATRDPYSILVSEIMLQQTQASRVLEKYEPFIKAFPGFSSLASAPIQQILEMWQGLGYNRRALALKAIAQKVEAEWRGKLPSSSEVLITFPGIGKATASAVAAFAFNKPTVFIETNIRRVFIHFFFQEKDKISDAEIMPLVEKTLDTSNPRKWYAALMDCGARLKEMVPNPNMKSVHYHKQEPFGDSNRKIRGMTIRALLRRPMKNEEEIAQEIQFPPDRVRENLRRLEREGFITKKRGKYCFR